MNDDGLRTPYRRLVCAVLLRACLDAHAGQWKRGVWRWIHSRRAAMWAALAGFDQWPPKREQLGDMAELRRRLRETE